MKRKDVDGYAVYSNDFSTPKFTQFFKLVEVYTKKYLGFVLGAAIVALAWAWVSALTPHTFTLNEMRDYAVLYINGFQ